MRVLLGTDGSDTARAAVRFIAGFPFPPDTEVRVLSVIKDVLRDHAIETLTPEQWDAFEHTKDTTQAEIDALMEADATLLREAGLAVSTEVRTGHPAAEILTAAEEGEVDLIVVGAHGLTGFKRFLLGSISSQVLQSANRSVMIVRKPERDCEGGQISLPAIASHPWRFLACYDGSPSSAKAIDFLKSLNVDDQSSVHLLTVLPMVTMFRQDIRQEMNWIWQEKKRDERARLDDVAEQLRHLPIHVTTDLVEAGDVSSSILAAGDDFDADLLILGHKGKGAIEKFLMGSVTPRIAHHSCRSVLAVR